MIFNINSTRGHMGSLLVIIIPTIVGSYAKIFNPRDSDRVARDKPYLEYLLVYTYRVASTHDLNAILFPPSSENTVGCIAV